MDRKLEAELRHQKKLSASQRFIENKKRFWDSVLELLPEIKEPILEIGNGPFGFFLSLQGKDMYCVDPLNERYLGVFSHLRGAKFISSNIESLEGIPKCKTVLSYNALDHVEDVDASLKRMCELSSDDAVFLIGVDCYPNGLISGTAHLLRKYIDVPHPHHFTRKGITKILGRHLTIERTTDESGFRKFHESAPGPDRSLAGAIYHAAYSSAKKAGLVKGYSLGIKKPVVFVLRKKAHESCP
ncbi:hypothetical protein GF318_03195 [Candidatus Micrarchaeota archaeon]|nr:hypothetical protein [Candidatus Micrarchaeota archaeon]